MTTSPTNTMLDAALAQQQITTQWDDDIVGQLTHYITIPAKSPEFDADWQANGFIDEVVQNAADWVVAQNVPGLSLEVLRLPGRTPLLFFEIKSTKPGSSQTLVMYGHLDKQPEFTGWRDDLGPWTPKYENGKLYGRGGADDGYAVYASIAAVQALKSQNIPHPRIVGLIEASEESGSPDLLPYIEHLGDRLGDVGFVVCLDSGAGDYDRLWLTTSLRGMVGGTLRVDVLDQGVHSGDASGMVPGSFRILRQLLDRLEDSATGRLQLNGLHCDIPAERVEQAGVTAQILGDDLFASYPWARHQADGSERTTQAVSHNAVEMMLARTWGPTLTVTGAEGLPSLEQAGNVLRPGTALKLSFRLPPLVRATDVAPEIKRLLESDPPYQARVIFESEEGANGWNAPPMAPWFRQALDAASQAFFGKPCGYIGQGGTIPLMNQLSEGFPAAQMMVCGVLGPGSNAHGPNEFLHVPFAKRLTACVAEVMARVP